MESINNQNKNTIIQANFGANSRQVVPMIAGVEITTDSEGRFNLNALHKASGEGESKKPSEWLRTKQAQELIAELSSQMELSGNFHLGQKAVNSVMFVLVKPYGYQRFLSING